MEFADLEIGIFKRGENSYIGEIRYTYAETAVDIRRRSASVLTFDFEQLRESEFDSDQYGRLLSDCLFSDQDLKLAFIQARDDALTSGAKIHMRLFLGPYAIELHQLRWETLRAPDNDEFLFTRDQIYFSRYLSSYDWRPVRLRTKGDLRGLVVISAPNNLDQYAVAGNALHLVNVEDEIARAKDALSDIAVTTIDENGQITLDNIFNELEQGYDFLYLVCHGSIKDGSPYLWLEHADGTVHHVHSRDFLNRIRDLTDGPRLVVLASCQSGGSGEQLKSSDVGALAAIGPQMAATGTPAVVAMQGNITATTLAAYMPVFFKELQKNGQIDRAMAIARRAVKNRPDWWVPTLFMRLKSGRIWYSAGFTGKQLKKWPALLANIRDGLCTPVLGPGLAEPLVGTRREIAQNWARTYHFPMAPYLTGDLPQVAQFLATDQQLAFPQQAFVDYARNEMISRFGDIIKAADNSNRNSTLDQMISIVGEHYRSQHENEAHSVLARLPLPVYITTNFTNMMGDALVAEGKQPVVEFCRWKDELLEHPSIYDSFPDYTPTPEKPLIFHLFGHLSLPESLVLTEDNYFDFLIGANRNRDLIPPVVRRALTDRGLLILGYHLDDWNFRVLFRSFLSFEGGARRKLYANVAAQLDPEENQILEPERARDYLQSYFLDSAQVSIFWGAPRDFAVELAGRL